MMNIKSRPLSIHREAGRKSRGACALNPQFGRRRLSNLQRAPHVLDSSRWRVQTTSDWVSLGGQPGDFTMSNEGTHLAHQVVTVAMPQFTITGPASTQQELGLYNVQCALLQRNIMGHNNSQHNNGLYTNDAYSLYNKKYADICLTYYLSARGPPTDPVDMAPRPDSSHSYFGSEGGPKSSGLL